MKRVLLLFILISILYSCTKKDSGIPANKVIVDSTNLYLPKKMVRYDTAVKYVGFDTVVNNFTYNNHNQLSKMEVYTCHYDSTLLGTTDTFQYYYNYRDSLKTSMPTSYRFVAKIAGIGTASDEYHSLNYFFGVLLADSAKTNIPLSYSIDTRHVFYTYSGNSVTMMAPNTLSKEGNKMYFSNDGTIQKEEYLNGTTVAKTTTYFYDVASVINPFIKVKAFWLYGWSNNIFCKSPIIPSYYNDSNELQSPTGKNGSSKFVVDGLGRLTYVRDVSTWQSASIRISY